MTIAYILRSALPLLSESGAGLFAFWSGTSTAAAKTPLGSAGKKRERTPGEKFAIATLEAIAELRGLPKDTWTKDIPPADESGTGASKAKQPAGKSGAGKDKKKAPEETPGLLASLGAGIGNWLDSRAEAAQAGEITASGSPAQETAVPETPLSQQPKGEAPKSFAQRMSDWLDSRAEAAQAGEITATGDPTYIESELTPDELRPRWARQMEQMMVDTAQFAGGVGQDVFNIVTDAETRSQFGEHFPELVFDNALAGLSGLAGDVTSTADWLIQTDEGFWRNLFNLVYSSRDYWAQQAAQVNEASGTPHLGQLVQVAAEAAPGYLLGKAVIPSSSAGLAAPNTLSAAAARTARDPSFWMDAFASAGPAYEAAKAAGMDDFNANIAAFSTGVSMGAIGAGELPVPQVDNPYLADMSEEALREWLGEAFLRQMYGQMGR